MDDYYHIDELIRQKFEDFEPVPPETVWEKVRAKIGSGGPSPKGNHFTLPIIIGIIVMVALTGLLLLFTRIETATSVQAAASGQLMDQSALPSHLASLNQRSVTSGINPSDNTQGASQETTPDRSANISQIPVRKPFDGRPDFNYKTYTVAASDQPVRTEKKVKAKKDKDLQRFETTPWHMKGTSFTEELDPGTVNISDLDTRGGTRSGSSVDYVSSSRPEWSIGFHFNPEVTFYPSDNISNELNYSFQVLPQIKFGNWFLSSGVSVRSGNDKGNSLINYNKYLGSYQDVYMMTFDSTENGIVPTYYTQTVDVYDTVPYYSISEAKARYTYLDVPLLVGHEWAFNHVSLYVQAGPALSFFLGRSNPSMKYPEENIRILSKEQQIPAREQINWQMMAGAGFGYNINDKVSLNLEPTFRYYLTRDYKQNDLNPRHPYSLGIRAGIIYHFNH